MVDTSEAGKSGRGTFLRLASISSISMLHYEMNERVYN